ncbi:hypothetical protein ABTZ59_22905 [Streptomyces sp. NPDC094034]|uniref:effector-associated constant component EACC1 n=1 Tax=Streptomyces sp. NPDC094034 TaxID=3155309 RepID=UPI00332D99F5
MLEVRFEARSLRFDSDDDRWASQLELLHKEIEEAAGSVRHRPPRDAPPTPGVKGAVSEVLVALAPVAIPSVAAVLTMWLKRDRGRSVRLTWTVDGRSGEFTASGDALDTITLRTALEHGLRAAADNAATADDNDPGGRAEIGDQDGTQGA